MKPTASIKKAVPQIKKRGLLSYNGEKDDEVIQLNTPELGLLQHLLQNKGRVNPKTGILSFAEGGGPGSGSHDSNHDSGGGMGGGGNASGGGSRGGTGTTANGGGLASPEGGGGSVSGKGNPSNDHSSGPGTTGTTARGGMQSSPESAGGSINGPGLGNGPSSDPTSPLGVLGLAVRNFFSKNPLDPQNVVGTVATAALGPLGYAAKAALSYGMAAGQKNKEVLDGIHNGTIDGSTSTDANGTEVGHVGGSQYGGTASTHGGNTGIGGGGGDPAYFNQQQQQNALNASTGIPGMIQKPPAGIPSLGLLGQYSQPYQQWTTPGYGFQVPGQGYLQWGQK